MNRLSWNRRGAVGIFCFAMTRKTHLALTAGSAIAAALAIAPVPLLAQDVIVPTITAAPTVPPPAIPAPAPEVQTVMTSSPVVQETPPEPSPAPEPEASAAPAPATAARATAAPVRATAPVERAAAAVPSPATPIAPAVDADQAVAPVAAPVDPVAAPVPVDTTDRAIPANDPTEALLPALIAAIAVGGLAIWGFVAIGRRRRPYSKAAAVPVVERRVITPPQPQPVAAEPVAARFAPVTPLASPRPAEALTHTGASVALPRTLPATFAERDALLRRMIDARPDRANPFRSRKARARRARLIMQTLGRDFEGKTSRIDLSQYQANWPSLAHGKSAAA